MQKNASLTIFRCFGIESMEREETSQGKDCEGGEEEAGKADEKIQSSVEIHLLYLSTLLWLVNGGRTILYKGCWLRRSSNQYFIILTRWRFTAFSKR